MKSLEWQMTERIQHLEAENARLREVLARAKAHIEFIPQSLLDEITKALAPRKDGVQS